MSSLLSAIASLVSWIVFFTIKSKEQAHPLVRPLSLVIGLLSSLIFLWQMLARFAVIIPAGEVGVMESLGQVDQNTLPPGIYFVNPFTDIITYSTRLQDIKETVDTTSKEGLSFKMDVSLQYRLDPAKAGGVFQKIGSSEQQQEIITSRFRSLIRQITANYPLTDIYGEKRGMIAQNLRQSMANQLFPLGFIVEDALLRNIILPDNIQAAIQSKVAMEQETQKIDLEIQKAKKEAERKLVEARGTANAQKVLSEGLTDKIIQLKTIEATEKLGQSPNSKIIIVGGGGQKTLPLMLTDDK